MIDVSEEDLVGNYNKIRSELLAYDKNLYKKKEIIVFNKSDIIQKDQLKNKLKKFKNRIKNRYNLISTYNKTDIDGLKKSLIKHAS